MSPGQANYLDAFIRTAQYLASLTTQQDVWSETGQLLVNFWRADLGCFGERRANGEIVIHHWTFSAELSKRMDLTSQTQEDIAEVLDSGFLTWRFISLSPESLVVAFLPITQENQVTRVLLVGHRGSELLPKDLLNLYLALAGLVGATAERLAAEAELRKHRRHLEELVRERTAQLTHTIEQLQHEIAHRQRAEEALQEAHGQLEFRVLERTAALENAREAAAAERQRLYDILETMPVMVCLLTSDHRVAFVNRSYREKFGEDNGRHCFDYRFGLNEPCAFCEVYNVLRTGKPHHWQFSSLDGSIIDAYDFPFTDTDGSPLVLEIAIDITQSKRAEEALRAAGTYNRRLLEASLDPLVTISTDGRITDVNTATQRITGRSREELIGTDFASYFKDPEKARFGYEQVFRDGLVKNYELAIRHKNGWLTPVMYNASLYRDEDGKILGVFAAARDISDRKQAEEELIRSNRDLQQFAYVASHDLQEPLRNVASCLQMLEKKYESRLDADADQYIRYAVEGAVRMKALIQDLLAYSRVGTRGKPPGPTDCEQILAGALQNLRSAIIETRAMITHDPLPTIPADDTQVLQVFQNLIGNAIKFRRDDPPRIHVSAVKNRNEWIFSVKDNGIGIESRHLDRIFMIFQRLHKRSQYDGTGMGLAIVKKVVERHGGRVWVESEPGKESTFYFTIPVRAIRK